MIFEIEPTLSGSKVNGNGTEYLFTTKLFSHSSLLLDKNSNIVASLSRSSWWRMNFNVTAGDNTYVLKQKVSETELIFNKFRTRFYTASGLEFYNKSTMVTRLKNSRLMSQKMIIEIKEKDHWLALLAATCLECSVVTQSG